MKVTSITGLAVKAAVRSAAPHCKTLSVQKMIGRFKDTAMTVRVTLEKVNSQ